MYVFMLQCITLERQYSESVRVTNEGGCHLLLVHAQLSTLDYRNDMQPVLSHYTLQMYDVVSAHHALS